MHSNGIGFVDVSTYLTQAFSGRFCQQKHWNVCRPIACRIFAPLHRPFHPLMTARVKVPNAAIFIRFAL